ncbi:MAG: shikimate kinase [Oscillospiraceae bacterium]|jgi:shikimate dehydrogenase|nr:shikimate kinase [Oscillospiraceae bacterium]
MKRIEFGLVGEKLSHSHSPRIHRMLSDYKYELIEVDGAGLRKLLSAREFRGLNVTIPYKVDALEYCDVLTDDARAVGSVNTLVVDQGGRLIGDNTDLYGFEELALHAGISMENRKALILGSGGSSRMAQAAARRAGAREIVVVSRGGPVDYQIAAAEHDDADIIINTTPVGMYPNNGAAPVHLADYPRCAGVIDLIYNPLRTALLLSARSRGIPCADGLPMLIAQARRAAQRFTGNEIERERDAVIDRALRLEQTNVVLIGMPGSGKSAIGRRLADRMRRPFVDIDERIAETAGVDIPTIFSEQGEAAFRALEREATAEAGKRQGLVIAVGGGCPIDPRNADALRQNGVLIWVRRSLEQLATSGRPLSTGLDALRAIEKAREPIYQRTGDVQIANDGGVEEAVEAAFQAISERQFI